MTEGMLAAVSGAIGEADNLIGGYLQTRLTAAIDPSVALTAIYLWDGTLIVLTSDTSEVLIGDWISLDIPSPQVLTAVLTWNATLTVTTPDTSEVTAGDWIRLDSDGIWYEIQSVTPNTSFTILNPGSFTIPTGATQSSKASETVTDGQRFQVIAVTLNTSVEIFNPTGYPLPLGTSPSSKVRRSLPVESVLNWAESGRVGLDGISYYYSSRTDISLDEITHIKSAEITAGVKKIHSVESVVINLNREQSALDLVRRAMLVDYAEGNDLNALGRNLGVNRLPFLASDEVFRAIIKALAYNPKGTMFGLELALDAMIGAGNYEIVEDLISDPCTVFIRFLGAAATEDRKEGKAFLTGAEAQPANGDTSVFIDYPVADRGSVGSVRWKNEDLLTDCRTAYPSAHLITEYDGDTPHAAYILSGFGGSEGVNVTLTGTAVEFTSRVGSVSLFYYRLLRLQPESYAWASVIITVPTGSPNDLATFPTGCRLFDGQRWQQIMVFADTSSTFTVGLSNGTSVFYSGGTQLNRDQFYELTIEKKGTDVWQFYIDGVLIETAPYLTSLAATLSPRFMVGYVQNSTIANQMQLKQIAVYTHTYTDYWTARGTGSVSSTVDQRLDAGSSIFVAGDVGKLVETQSTANDINNGRYLIDSLVSGQVVELRGPVEAGLIAQSGGSSIRVEVPPLGRLFQYPDDIGKELIISESVLGNNGIHVIAALLQPVTLTDLSAGATPVPEKTYIAEVVAASFVPETALSWQVNPEFITEAAVDWELSDAGEVVGQLLLLRQALPLSAAQAYRVLDVIYSNVLSAQILANASIKNEVIQEVPDLLFSYYPFYLADPLGFARAYLDSITAAGVIPEFLVD